MIWGCSTIILPNMLMLSTFILQNIIFDDKSSGISLENQKSLQDNSNIEQTHLFFLFFFKSQESPTTVCHLLFLPAAVSFWFGLISENWKKYHLLDWDSSLSFSLFFLSSGSSPAFILFSWLNPDAVILTFFFFSLSVCVCLLRLPSRQQSGWSPWMPVIAVMVAVTAAVLYPNLSKSSSA